MGYLTLSESQYNSMSEAQYLALTELQVYGSPAVLGLGLGLKQLSL